MIKKMDKRKKAVVIAVIIVVVAVIASRTGLVRTIRRTVGQQRLLRFTDTQEKMGTFVTITVFSPSRRRASKAMERAFARIDELEDIFSTYNPDSEISLCNRRAAAELVSVSDDAFHVLRKSVEFSRKSDGAFDITVAPLIKLWRSSAEEERLPLDDAIESALEKVGYGRVTLDENNKTVRFEREGVELDLGGIAKGFIIDEAVRALAEENIKRALVNAGGDIYALGQRADGRDWTVGVQDPRLPDDDRAMLGVLDISDKAVATSGNYQRYTIIEGVKYSHIIDPRIGRPADAIPSVTVIAADALTADALATALSVLSLKDGLALAEGMDNVEALLITIEDGEPVMHYTNGFPDME